MGGVGGEQKRERRRQQIQSCLDLKAKEGKDEILAAPLEKQAVLCVVLKAVGALIILL